jgi:CDGSH-type Zn-finger protein
VRVWENGPLAFHAELDVADETASFRATLCRCGHSKLKPYCDHSHVEAGFTATGEPASKPSEPLARRDGPLKVTPRENGPLVVEGSLEICSASGRTISRETRTVLCRCGGSANKPFCDGTHKKIGFIASALSQ